MSTLSQNIQNSMRIIKFRAWDGKEFLPLTREVAFIDDDGCLKSRIEGIVFSQFTGLTDRHGKEIYQGDIVKRDNYPHPFTVVWEKDGYWLQDTEVENSTLLGIDNEHCEVVGNIHETREAGEQP